MASKSIHGTRLSGEFYPQLMLILLTAVSFRAALSMWGHSGEGKPPMHGDFEAQRHWMEITSNLTANQWYVQGPKNDLQYWGLDYPPLTAYHMMAVGLVAKKINPDVVELGSSHGIEGPDVKFFMRFSVLFMDVFLFLPAASAYFIFSRSQKTAETNILSSIMVIASYPGLILIDNGHFQYNNVSLGLFVLATLALCQTFDLLAALLFCLALNYKQMELYHALPFFAYLFGRCIKSGLSRGLLKFVGLGFIVLATFSVTWSPFLGSVESAMAVVTRLFPFNRGLYEDKVANFWCSISPLIKFKEIIAPQYMAKICMVVTSLLALPSFIDLLRNPIMKKFLYSSINISLVFFLFSFHVHEKSILIVAIPACLVIDKDPFAVIWFLLISVFSMVPLLMKDGLLIPTMVAVSIFWIGSNHFVQPTLRQTVRLANAMHLSLLGAVCLVLATILVPPPERFPDLLQLLIAIYSCAHFFMFALYFHIKQLSGNNERVVWKFLEKLSTIGSQGNPSGASSVKPSEKSSKSKSIATSRSLRQRKYM